MFEGSLMLARGKQQSLEQCYVFLFSDILIVASQNSDNLQFRVKETIVFDSLASGSENPALCLERVTDELGDFGLRLRSVHHAGLVGNDSGLKV